MNLRALYFSLGLLVTLALMPGKKGNALATMADTLELGSKATAMGGAFCALADDYSAVYYNPAGLAQENRNRLYLATQYAKPFFWIQKSSGDKEVKDLDEISGISIATTSNWGQLFGYEQLRRLSSGLFIYYPYQGIYDIKTDFPTDRHFLMYQDRNLMMVIILSMAYKILPSLSIGVGANFSMGLDMGNYVVVEGLSLTVSSMTLRRDARTGIAPQIGLLFKPLDKLSFGINFMDEVVTRQKGPFVLQMGEGISTVGEVDMYSFNRPRKIDFGVAYEPNQASTLSFDLCWLNWSRYKDILHDIPDPKFKDILVPHLGIEYVPIPRLAVRGGYYYEMSPVPDQTGKSDYIDNNKHVLSVGAGWTTEARSTFPNKPISIEGHFQCQLLEEREFYRGFSAGGYLFNAGLSLTVHY